MLRAIAALALFSAAGVAGAAIKSSSSDTLVSTAPWWEKVTVTIAGNGKPAACRFETSLKPDQPRDCDVVASHSAVLKSASARSNEEFTRITFERRFTPGAEVPAAALQPGDQLLGKQVLALAIDGQGAVKNCHIVDAGGDMRPEYGCADAAAEHFQASAATAKAAPQREATMTILVYGHSEHMV